MESNFSVNNQRHAPSSQLVEVKVPVRAGMSNSLFVFWFVFIFVTVFIALSYFGLVPEGVREINRTVFSLGADTTSESVSEAIATDPLASTSQMLSGGVVSPELAKEEQVVIAQPAGRSTGQALTATYSNEGKVLPIRLIVTKIGLNTSISNPTSERVSVLDQALLSGGVRYPASASLEENGNMLLFGHSTGLAVVRNKAYQAFNGINKLAVGDEIKIQSASKEYLYKVSKVSKVSADKQIVQFGTTSKMLTLSTCDSFGTKADRFVVEAQFVRSYPLTK